MLGKTTYQRVLIITAIITGGALVIAGLIWLLTGLAGPGSPARVGRIGVSVDQRASLPVKGVSTLSIETTSDDILVIEGEGDTVEAWFHGTISPRSPEALPRLVEEKNGDGATLRIEYPGPNVGIMWSNLALEVRVPPAYAGSVKAASTSGDMNVAGHAYAGLELTTTSGDITAAAMRVSGDIALRTTSGSVTTDALTAAGDASVQTHSGDVSVAALAAAHASLRTTSGAQKVKSATVQDLELASSSGDIRVLSLTGSVAASASSGSVDLVCTAVPPKMEVETTSGDITILLPSDALFTLDAHASSGDIACAFPITVTLGGGKGSVGEHTLSGTVGSAAGTGMPAIRLRATSGEIRIKR
jgi:lia operon protein LiaG